MPKIAKMLKPIGLYGNNTKNLQNCQKSKVNKLSKMHKMPEIGLRIYDYHLIIKKSVLNILRYN